MGGLRLLLGTRLLSVCFSTFIDIWQYAGAWSQKESVKIYPARLYPLLFTFNVEIFPHHDNFGTVVPSEYCLHDGNALGSTKTSPPGRTSGDTFTTNSFVWFIARGTSVMLAIIDLTSEPKMDSSDLELNTRTRRPGTTVIHRRASEPAPPALRTADVPFHPTSRRSLRSIRTAHL